MRDFRSVHRQEPALYNFTSVFEFFCLPRAGKSIRLVKTNGIAFSAIFERVRRTSEKRIENKPLLFARLVYKVYWKVSKVKCVFLAFGPNGNFADWGYGVFVLETIGFGRGNISDVLLFVLKYAFIDRVLYNAIMVFEIDHEFKRFDIISITIDEKIVVYYVYCSNIPNSVFYKSSLNFFKSNPIFSKSDSIWIWFNHES